MAKSSTLELESQEHTINPAPGQDEGADAVKDPGAESSYSDLPNHNALLPQPGEVGAPDDVTHFRVLSGLVMVPVVFVDSDGKTRVTGEPKMRDEIVERSVIGDEQRIAHLLGLKAIQPVKK